MTDSADNFASLSLKDVAGNRFALLNKIQEQVCSAISALHSGKDLLSIKKNVQYILEQVNKNLDLIKASCKEKGTNRHLAGNGFYTLSAGWIMRGGVLLGILGEGAVMPTIPLLAGDLYFFASSPALPLWFINVPLFTSTINIEYLVKNKTDLV